MIVATGDNFVLPRRRPESRKTFGGFAVSPGTARAISLLDATSRNALSKTRATCWLRREAQRRRRSKNRSSRNLPFCWPLGPAGARIGPSTFPASIAKLRIAQEPLHEVQKRTTQTWGPQPDVRVFALAGSMARVKQTSRKNPYSSTPNKVDFGNSDPLLST